VNKYLSRDIVFSVGKNGEEKLGVNRDIYYGPF
jgi:hypothetical protein